MKSDHPATEPPSVPTAAPNAWHRNAVDETFRSKCDALERIAERITRNRADAEDVVQWAFLRAHEQSLQMPPERLLQWLKTVVRRLAIDRTRRSATQARYVETLRVVECIAVAVPGFGSRDGIGDLCALTLTLPDATRRTFSLWCAGVSYEAIALAQRIPVGTVAARILRARTRLRALYGRQ